ncbi:hypothetical protein DE146DRAFT_791525 [Phaeosphaeria sp. MPI-PUGE-AT-0046c]|nr:hypothetical protein DE146DRAFT_791525 [Phaeosphaeria sp. MPI-PUGE-AT-0046c]
MATSPPLKLTPKPPSLGSTLQSEVVVVEIGTERQRYHVHKTLLVHHSEYFAKALEGPWTEAHTRVITLADIEAGVFNIFVQWLYCQQLPSGKNLVAWGTVSGNLISTFNYIDIVAITLKAYAFGDRFLIPPFRRAMNQAVQEGVRATAMHPEVMVNFITWAFENIPSDRPVLQLLVNEFCQDWTVPDSDNDTQTLDFVALRDFSSAFTFRAMLRYRELSNPLAVTWHKKGCYLEHASGEEKMACGRYHVQYSQERDYGYLVEEC